ncbi:MAG: hypothetical protein KAH10_01995 [Flavobacteriales bacterium]|nr:hypothetical protein [Flavobacteriales bacterium]
MQVSVDISLYPLKEEFKAPIKDFINKIDKHGGFKVKRNNMSTSIFGDYKEIMHWLTDNMELTLMDDENAIFVIKVVGGDYFRE